MIPLVRRPRNRRGFFRAQRLKIACVSAEDRDVAAPASRSIRITGHVDLSALELEDSLPSLPAAAVEVVRVCSDPKGDASTLAQALAHDPILASQVMRVANSAWHYRGSEVTTLQRAATVLGMRALKVVALGFTLANEMPRTGVAAGLDLNVYWHRSVLNAVVARSLARTVDPEVAEEAFLCGLLTDLGKLVLTHAIPEQYAPLVAESGGWPAIELERDRLGFAASEAAERVLRSWNVPELLVQGAAFAPRQIELPADTSDEARRIAAIVGLARLGAAIVFDADASVSIGRFAVEAQRRFGLSAAEVEAIIAGLERDSREAATILSLELPSDVSYKALREQARDLIVAMSVDAMLQLDESSKTIAELEREMESLQTRARADALTGLPNRAMLDAFLTQQVHQRLRDDLPGHLGVILIGIDRFGDVKDAIGREGGDAMLQSVIGVLEQQARHSDLLGRFGSEEFCLVVPHATREMLADAGERLRAAIEAHEVDLGVLGSWRASASFGCACLLEVTAPGDVVKLIAASGAALHEARKAGGNRVASAPEALASH
jgi:diguanylate cyclase (GGDEF)-like protein